ncbi:hypothetical protein PRIPAC_78782 [Pristionchus pacificus]|uniref:Uncharacterized protein n=1 Tax=Pristionchus pacificus TaxID=54126 RepID=A0A2A6BHY8_PRIPA|nr:hypothetical protein PRIPAC_78782 [Pristionchus pacificus]|eukprot:PDM65458.1 hypothetical protein PRIPAC_52400 [Pristionchus pacificus]
MDPPPPVLATQESVDVLTKLVKSLHVKLDKLFSSSATRVVLVGSTEKDTPEETSKNDEEVLRTIIETTKDKDLKEAYAAGTITHARFPANNPPGPRFFKRDLMPSELEQERSARMEARKKNFTAGCLRWGVRDCCSMEAPAIKLSPNVDQEMDTLSPIERLPRELVWKIIDFVPEAVLNLMATSPALQWRVLEYARQPLTIPILDRVGISRSNSINTRMWVWMYVPKRLSTLFELRLIVRERPPTMTRTIKRLFHEVPFHLYRYELDANMDGSPTIDYLRGIFGNHLGYFWVNGPSYNNLMSPYVIRLLDGMKIRRLEMMIDDLSEEIASQILERIKKHACEQLILTIRNVAASKNAVQFLHDLSSAVRSIRIIQSEVAGISEDANFLFGIQDGDWARVILEMFSRKVDKLLIDTHYKGYLTKGGVDFLREKLPSLGEKVWFDTDCIAYENDMNYVRDGLSVAFDADDQRLRMKNSSRTEELFRS